MGSNNDQIIDVTVVVQNPGVTAAGFGVPLILTPRATWTERTRVYKSIDAVLSDWAATTPEYFAAAACFAQDPAPSKIMIGRAIGVPTKIVDIAIEVVANSTVYALKCWKAGVLQVATYTSGAGATDVAIVAGLKAAFNALAAPDMGATAATVLYDTAKLRITADAPGNFFAVEPVNQSVPGALCTAMSIEETTANPATTTATDLAAIKLESNDWYGLVLLDKSAAIVDDAAGWIENNTKIFVPAMIDSAIATDADSGATDEAHELKAASRKRTAVFFHPRAQEFADAAEEGAFFAIDPGSDDWTLKELSGVTDVRYTDTQTTNLTAKNCNWYQTMGNLGSIGGEGMVASGQYIDVIRDVDQMCAWYQEAIVNLKLQLANMGLKLPLTDAGILKVKAVLDAVNKKGVKAGIVAEGTDSISVPKAADVSSTDKGTRTLPNCNISWELAGAIHHIKVNVAVSL